MASDGHFRRVSLLLHCDGADTSTSFPDASRLAHTVTANGNAQVDTAQSKWGGASALFDGTNSYLSVPHSAGFNWRNGEGFTIEGWIRNNGNAATQTVMGYFASGGASQRVWKIEKDTSGVLKYYQSSDGSTWNQASAVTIGTATIGTWMHFAVCVTPLTNNGKVITLLNGVQGAYTALSNATQNPYTAGTTNNLYIGSHGSGEYFDGWLDDIRITHGVQRYGGALGATPPAAFPDTDADAGDANWANCVMAMDFDSNPGTKGFRDKSDKEHPFINSSVNAGTLGHQRFGGRTGSAGAQSGTYFPESDDWNVGSGDWTMEWYQFAYSITSAFHWSRSAAGTGAWRVDEASGTYRFSASTTGGSYDIANAVTMFTPNDFAWHHMAVVRDGSTFRFFLDGKQINTTSSAAAIWDNSHFYMSPFGAAHSGGKDWAKFYKGVAKYTSDFYPPQDFPVTSAGTPTNAGDPYFNKVCLLLRANGKNNVAVLGDYSHFNFPVSTTSAAVISTTQSVWGGSSAYFPAATAASRLNVNMVNDDLKLFGWDFTIEFSIYCLSSYPSTTTIFGQYSNLYGYMPWGVTLDGTTLKFFATSTGASYDIANAVSMGTPDLNQWNHYAVTREGSTWRTYKNGTKISEFTSSASIYNSTQPLYIGGNAATPANAYMDEMRITRGVARYTGSTYDLATEQFPVRQALPSGDSVYDEVKLLMHMDGAAAGTTFTDSSSFVRSAATAVNATTETDQLLFGTASGKFDGHTKYIWWDDLYSGYPYGDMEPTNRDFTYEFAYRRTNATPTIGTVIGKRGPTSEYGPLGFVIQASGNMSFYSSSAGASWDIASGLDLGAATLDTWVRFAVTRQGSAWRAYRDGVKVQEWTTNADLNQVNNAQRWQIGADHSGLYGAQGYVDEVRYTLDYARYLGPTYTLATSAFPDYAATLITSITGDVAIEVGVDSPKWATTAFRASDTAIEVGVESPYEGILTQKGTDTAIEVGVSSPVSYQTAVRLSDTAIEIGVDAVVYSNTSVRPGDVGIEVGVASPYETETGNYTPGTITTDLTLITADMAGWTSSGLINADLPGIIDSALSGYTAPAGGITAPLTLVTAVLAGGEKSITALLPSPITAQLDGYAAVAGAITTQLPRQYALLSGYIQGTGRISARLRRVRASLAGYIVPTGSIDVELPLIKGILGGAQAAIGSITAELPESIEALLEGYLQVSGTISAKLLRIEPWILAERGLTYLRTYAMNTNTKALVEFNAFDFASLTEYKGQVLGLKADGLYVVGGGTDNGAPIASLFESGLVDYKVPQIKRMSEMYFSGAVDGRLKISCQVEQKGSFYSYYLADDGVSTIRQRKVNIGKGLRGRYWKVRIENVDGADFAFDDITVNYGQTRRKVGA